MDLSYIKQEYNRVNQYYVSDKITYCSQMRSVSEQLVNQLYNILPQNKRVAVNAYTRIKAIEGFYSVIPIEVIGEMHTVRRIGNNYSHGNYGDVDKDALTVSIGMKKIVTFMQNNSDRIQQEAADYKEPSNLWKYLSLAASVVLTIGVAIVKGKK